MLLSPEIALENGSSVKIGIGDRRSGGGRRGLLSSIEVVKWLCLYPVKARSCSLFFNREKLYQHIIWVKNSLLKKINVIQ